KGVAAGCVSRRRPFGGGSRAVDRSCRHMVLAHALAPKRRGRRTAAQRGRIMTTVELPPDLHEEARIYSVKHRVPLRRLLEDGLRELLARQTKEESDGRVRGRKR